MFALERPQITGPLTCCAIDFTDSKSPWLDTGKPASIISTFIAASCCATNNFSWKVKLAPGDCSPSLKVVSKKTTVSFLFFFTIFISSNYLIIYFLTSTLFCYTNK